GAGPAFWWPLGQLFFTFTDMSVVLRCRPGPGQPGTASLTDPLRRAVGRLDSGLALADVRLMNQIADESVSKQRFALFLVGLFALLALVLATIGIYGVISYSVNQRMHEFGMRLALGARPGNLIRLILSHGLKLSAVGAAVGLLSAIAFSRLLGNL